MLFREVKGGKETGMPATHATVFDALWPWFVKWGADGKLLVAARAFSGFLGTTDEDDDEAEDDSVDLDTTMGALTQIPGNATFGKLKDSHQQAYIELVTALYRINLDFDPNHQVSLQQNSLNNPGLGAFFIGELLALCADLRTFGPRIDFKPAKTIKNVLRIMKVAKDYLPPPRSK
jgi:hypothetical protein